MTSHGRDPQLAKKTLVLATDLDGTFLGGTDAARAELYDFIRQNRDSIGLIFVTGRDPDFVAGLAQGGEVPAPDYVVGDVGTTIARMGSDLKPAPIEALEADIAAAWGDAGPRVRQALEDAPGLRLQPETFRYRVSYDMDPARFDPAATRRIEAMGLDVLISDNRFFDVLPPGVSKGPSLLRLVDHFGIAHRRCLAAGDTLNDLSMLAAGLPAVAVGNCEDALRAKLAGMAHVHMAAGHGAAGITEAIRAFNYFAPSPA